MLFLVQDGDAAEGGGSLLFPLIMIVGLFAIFYFLLIRPQRKRRDQQTQLQSGLSVGDEVVTIGGLYGTVVELDDQTVILETSEGVYSRYARGAISQKVNSADDSAGDTNPGSESDSESGPSASDGSSGSDSSGSVVEQRDKD